MGPFGWCTTRNGNSWGFCSKICQIIPLVQKQMDVRRQTLAKFESYKKYRANHLFDFTLKLYYNSSNNSDCPAAFLDNNRTVICLKNNPIKVTNGLLTLDQNLLPYSIEGMFDEVFLIIFKETN